ncbi:MAG TPA: membrane protein insertion efficiency factor YidD [Spirochaetia bacterium]|nr:MAG: membrane protein insertion efficiency factor YidD [Spirochaetes bacterium GWB1_36_13]HCL57356.1 membrane protein insertion efficiency factor YidD [Spirochaetia bacterium]
MLNFFMILLIRFYQMTLSRIFGNNCRFYPSCSEYGLECFKNHHFFKAFGKTTWRILRCNPFGKGGYDPCTCQTKDNKNNRKSIL